MSKDKQEFEPEEIIRMSIMNPDFFKLNLEHRKRREAERQAKAANANKIKRKNATAGLKIRK